MPIKFPCQSCGQVLSVGERKAGRKAKCPKCGEPLVVPGAQVAEMQMAERRAQRATVPDDEEPDPYTQFAVYDDEDEMELVYENEAEPVADARPIEQNLVAVPRVVLYVQGVMLGLVALASFTIGVIVGGSGGEGDSPAASQPIPCAIDGTVSITTSTFQVIPDDGAQVFALPVGREPEPRAMIEGLRPQDPPPEDSHEGLAAIHSIRGGYARTNAEGRFHLSLPDVGDYYLLIVSRNANRSQGEEVPVDDIVKLGTYFTPPAGDLVGNKKYSFQLLRIAGNMPLEVVLK